MCLYEFYSMHALKWNLKQKQRLTFLQNSCVNFVLGIRLARWSSGSRFLETLRAAAPSAHSDLPPAPSPVSTLPTLVWTPSSLFGDENKRWTPLTCTECGMNRGLGENVWILQYSSNTPPTHFSSSIPQYSFETYLTHIPFNSLLQKHQTRPQSR